MLDSARTYEQTMYDIIPSFHSSTPHPPTRLEGFQVLKKGPYEYIYEHYYASPSYDDYVNTEFEENANVYHNLLSSRDYSYKDEWNYKNINEWNEEDTVSWIIATLQRTGFSEYSYPYYSFRIPGYKFKEMTRHEIMQKMSHISIDPQTSEEMANFIFDKLQIRMTDEIRVRERETVQYEESSVMLDLDTISPRYLTKPYNPSNMPSCYPPYDSGDEPEDVSCRNPGSPDISEGSRSSDEEGKIKILPGGRRPPGRPKGTGRKTFKRPKSVSVPEFLKELLLNPKFCPSHMKWEDYRCGKFRFVKPDEVAKLWGQMKGNDNMTFEKFSRAMRYHYKQEVLLSVPTARLVYQFGPKGPNYTTDNPNFEVKTELDMSPCRITS